jgi:hypothetical protein
MSTKQLKTRDIHIRISEKDFNEISSNAEALGLPVGTYLRLLGLLGIAPFIARELPGSGRFQSFRVDGVEEIGSDAKEVLVQKIHPDKAVS